MNKLSLTAIILSLVTIIVCIFYIRHYEKRLADLKDIPVKADTVIVTITDTVKVTIHDKPGVIIDTLLIDTAKYEIVEMDTVIAKDRNSVKLKVRYDEYSNMFNLAADFITVKDSIFVIKTITLPAKPKPIRIIGGVSPLYIANDKQPFGLGFDTGLCLFDKWDVSITGNTAGHIGLRLGIKY